MTQHTTKPHPHQRPTMGQRGRHDDNYEYALGNGGPAGSELGPVLNGVECYLCGEPLGKRYRMSVSRGSPFCLDGDACVERLKAILKRSKEERRCVKCGAEPKRVNGVLTLACGCKR